ncbi:GtrA family protein [Blastomonas sp. UPD001]|uniref:GtrA family protein n=1 Tax=Blastomonas sp. UPD001 TaxID=2217673 RepID=UPI001E37C2B1|nr:GtrA family protein [Blastomonas sp. UPD001]
MTGLMLVLSYAGFAVLATLANLASQRAVLALLPGGLLLALAVGTLVGLVVKFWLDRTWIFAGKASAGSSTTGTFGLYAATGVVTTLIFWGFETAAWLIWQTHLAREIGAVTGLAIGYLVKYRLDRRYVFAPARPA